MNDEDFGYFGTGSTGYAHYTQAHDRAFGEQKQTTSGSKYTPPITDPWEKFKHDVSRGLANAAPLFALLYGVLILLNGWSCLQGQLTFVEFINECCGYIIVFAISLTYTIYVFGALFKGKK